MKHGREACWLDDGAGLVVGEEDLCPEGCGFKSYRWQPCPLEQVFSLWLKPWMGHKMIWFQVDKWSYLRENDTHLKNSDSDTDADTVSKDSSANCEHEQLSPKAKNLICDVIWVCSKDDE